MGLLLLFARHGETADNAARIFQGQGGKGLNRLGRAQATRLAERMAKSPPSAIITSDLERAVETATIVAAACGDMPLILDPGLREVDVGSWTNKGYEEIKQLYPDEWAAWDAGLDIRRGGGETYGELADRIERTVTAIAERRDLGERILLVSHGGSIKSYVSRILGVSSEGLRALSGVMNASLTALERDGRHRHRLHSFNDAAHLEGLVAEEHAD